MEPKRRVLIIGDKRSPYLGGSYARALELLGHEVSDFDLEGAIGRRIRFGAAGRALFRVAPREPWIAGGNRSLVVTARERAVDIVIVPGAASVRAGALAQLKASLPHVKLVHLWPDPMLNLGAHVVQALPLYDLVGSYTQSAIEPLRLLGARRVEWIPFAEDHLLMRAEAITPRERADYECDICFLGNPRPERERAIRALVNAGLHVKVWGEAGWNSDVQDRALAKRYFTGRALYGAEFYKAMRSARLGLNVIDDTNYPGANMRFFEAPGCGTATLCSPCPEFAQEFRDGESVVYFSNERELVERARELLADTERREKIGRAGEKLVRERHTYVHRARQLLDAL